MSSEFSRNWALRWTEGVILGFTRGRIELNRALGMINRARKLGVNDTEILSIIGAIEDSPVYLPNMTKSQKRSKLKQIRDILEASAPP